MHSYVENKEFVGKALERIYAFLHQKFGPYYFSTNPLRMWKMLYLLRNLIYLYLSTNLLFHKP